MSLANPLTNMDEHEFELYPSLDRKAYYVRSINDLSGDMGLYVFFAIAGIVLILLGAKVIPVFMYQGHIWIPIGVGLLLVGAICLHRVFAIIAYYKRKLRELETNN